VPQETKDEKISCVRVEWVFSENKKKMPEWLTFLLILLAMIELAFMIVYVFLTSARLAGYDDQEATRAGTVRTMISYALTKTGISKNVRIYTVSVDLSATLSKPYDPALLSTVNVRSSSYNIYLNKTDKDSRQSLVRLSDVTDRINAANVEFLVCKDLSAAGAFAVDSAKGAIAYVVVGGQTFLILQFNGHVDLSSLTKDNGDDDTAIVIPLVSLTTRNFVSVTAHSQPTYSVVTNGFNTMRTVATRLTDVLTVASSSERPPTGFAIHTLIGF